MSNAGNGSPVLYTVHVSGQGRNILKQMHLQAAQKGNGQQFIAVFRQILRHLQQAPLQFGEPLYRLPALKLQVRKGGIALLLVDYAVYEEKPLVFIRGFHLLS
jgi:hypothetical protein